MELSKLEQARYARGWTREELATRVKVDSSTIQRWERGLTRPRGYHLQQLCAVFGMTATELGFQPIGQHVSRAEATLSLQEAHSQKIAADTLQSTASMQACKPPQ